MLRKPVTALMCGCFMQTEESSPIFCVKLPESTGFLPTCGAAPASGKLTRTAKKAVHMHTAAYEPRLSICETEATVQKSDAYCSPQAKLRPALSSRILVPCPLKKLGIARPRMSPKKPNGPQSLCNLRPPP